MRKQYWIIQSTIALIMVSLKHNNTIATIGSGKPISEIILGTLFCAVENYRQFFLLFRKIIVPSSSSSPSSSAITLNASMNWSFHDEVPIRSEDWVFWNSLSTVLWRKNIVDKRRNHGLGQSVTESKYASGINTTYRVSRLLAYLQGNSKYPCFSYSYMMEFY